MGLNLHKQDILCPDCGINYIDEARYINYKKCISCARRETIANTKNLPYVKYIELSAEEKERLEKQRAQNNAWAKKRNNKDEDNKVTVIDSNNTKSTETAVTKIPLEEKRTNERLVKEFLDNKKYLDVTFVSIKTTELYSQYMNFCNIKHYGVISRQEFYKILIDTFGFYRKMSNGSNYMCKGEKSKVEFDTITSSIAKSSNTKPVVSTRTTVRANQIYTEDVVEEILRLANTEKTIAELREEISQIFPNKNITVSNFNNIIVRKNVPHKVGVRFGTRAKENNSVEETNIEDVVNSIEIPTQVNDININSSTDEDGDPIRLVPIKQEVVSVLNEKFKQNKCHNQFNYTIEDYINMFEMFEYLSENIDILIRCRDKQFNIVNDYQFDIVHEMENELASDGDTYFQDKMYVLRDYRRYMEMDYKALGQMKTLLKSMKNCVNPNNPISKSLKSLKQIIKDNSQPKFVPRVDVNMTKKYDWALLRNSVYKRAAETSNTQNTTENTSSVETRAQQLQSTQYVDTVQPFNNTEPDEEVLKELNEMERTLRNDTSIRGNTSLTTVARLNANLKSIKSQVRLTADQVKQGFNVYRVSCKLSGGGYGVFRKWYKDYACIKSDIAMDFANQELARIKASNKGVLITDLACTKVASAD